MEGTFIGLEVHDHSIWEVDRMLQVVTVMETRGYNALILHENDLLDSLTQIQNTSNFGVSDLRWKKVSNKLAWCQKLIRLLSAFGARLYLQVKEPSYHDYVLKLFPSLIDECGTINPTSVAWTQLCQTKTELVLEHLPDIGGFIVNITSPESRVSLQDYLSDKSSSIDIDAWIDRMISAFHDPLKEAGKDLYIRDFTYTKELQKKTLEAIDRRNGEVLASIKITPHDYFPKFANNTIALDITAPKIFEFEAYGEHMGWGLLPNCRVKEFCERMAFVRDVNAKGFMVRISWEAMIGPHALDTLSDCNVFVLPYLMKENQDPKELTCRWLKEKFGVDEQSEVVNNLAEILLESWEVVASAYWNGSVFPRHSRLPSSWQEGWHSILTSGMGNRHINSKKVEITLTDEERDDLFEEKQQSITLAKRLLVQVKELLVQLPDDLAKLIKESFELLPLYAEMFDLATRGTVLAARNQSSDSTELETIHQGLLQVAENAQDLLDERIDACHTLWILFDPSHIIKFAQSLLGE
eukprot:TRINITY_DN10563_c0_g1_i1.p1 TRINITY_DN10563_c0_g1~~TRINITY_DN10563_c0_g1_i1.p1  ORF type:complete len:524 (+),score=92.33 TRINITY_DN10563_c0_g1_i1:93-1664(+)